MFIFFHLSALTGLKGINFLDKRISRRLSVRFGYWILLLLITILLYLPILIFDFFYSIFFVMPYMLFAPVRYAHSYNSKIIAATNITIDEIEEEIKKRKSKKK